MAKGGKTISENDIEKAFDEIRSELMKAQNAEPNVYQMMGISSLEKHHSSMFGGLLNHKEPHGLNNDVLKLFFKKLIIYTTAPDKKEANPKQNEDIIKKIFGSENDYNTFIDSITDKTNVEVELEVTTEYINPTTKKNGRMDILVALPEQKVVLVIENKYGTTTHSDQLVTYFGDIPKREGKKYDNYKKLFVFLSPFGDLPYNNGGNNKYNRNYCVFDYTENQGVCCVIKEIIKANINKKKLKLTKFALEQYLDMCKKEVLVEGYKNMDYKGLLKKYKDEYDALKKYDESAMNDDKVIPYCIEYLGLIKSDSAIWLHTERMKEVFERIDGKIDTTVCRVVCQTDSDNLVIYIDLARKNGTRWTEAQRRIFREINVTPNTDIRYKPVNLQAGRSIGKYTLLKKAERNNNFDNIKQTLNNRLDEFKKIYINEFETILGRI